MNTTKEGQEIQLQRWVSLLLQESNIPQNQSVLNLFHTETN
jgi:hypothetical protein